MLLREDPSRRSGSSEPSVEPEPSEESEEEPDDGNAESFDTQLPTQHSVRNDFFFPFRLFIILTIFNVENDRENTWFLYFSS